MKSIIPAVIALFFCHTAPAGNTEMSRPIFTGNFISVKSIPTGYEVQAENAVLRLMYYSPTILRFRIDREIAGNDFSYAVVAQPENGEFKLTESKEKLVFSTDSLQVTLTKQPLRISVSNRQGTLLSEDYQPFGTAWLGTEVTTYRKLFPDEKFVGLGEKTGNLNKRGGKYENWNSDVPAYAANHDPLYQSIPFFMGFHDDVVYGIFLDNSFRTKFNFGASTDEQFSSFSAADGEMNYYFFGASTPAGILRDYTWVTGRMPMPPIWSLGYQQCRWSYYPEAEVMSIARSFRDKKIPCDIIYLDIDYMDGYKIFTWNRERFPRPSAMIRELNSMGFHLATIVDPGIKIEKGYFAYDEGITNNYFAKYFNGPEYVGNVWPGRCHFPDFTRPTVRSWWGESFIHLTEPGVEGFWNDMNEPSAWGQSIPDIVKFDFDGNGATMAQAHNVYGLNMARATFEGTKKLLNGKRPFVLTRAGFAGIQRYSAVWTGDNEATDEHMLLSARMVTGLGLSGIAFTGPDLGGFIGNPSKELYSRWLSLGVYTPFFRNHSAWDTKSKEPWSFGRDIERFSRAQISQRYRLIPYIYSAFHEASASGMPVARSLVISSWKDEKVWRNVYQNEYLFGNDLLIAPVSCNQISAKVYLPEGDWYRFSSGEFYHGPQEILVPAPLDDLPVFVRASGIIPLQSVVQYTGEKPSDTLELYIYYGKPSNLFLYYEDDGISYGFEQGEYFRRNILFNPEIKQIRFEKNSGSYNSKFKTIRLILHGFKRISNVIMNGTEMINVTNNQCGYIFNIPFNPQEILLKYSDQ